MKNGAQRLSVAVLMAGLWCVMTGVLSASPALVTPVVIEFWYSDDCPHCQQAGPFLEAMAHDFPGIRIEKHEVWHDQANLAALNAKAAAHGYVPSALPNIYIGDRYWIGFSEDIGRQIFDAAVVEPAAAVAPVSPSPVATTLTLPLIGAVDLGGQSLLLSTVLIGLVDGINPCSLWVLSMLLALTLHTGSRRKVMLIGVVFLVVSSLAYALFITGLFTLSSLVSLGGWLSLVVALVTALFGLISLKDFFWFRKGPTLAIPASAKPGIFGRMRGLLKTGQSFGALVAGTAVLAAGVSLVELGCTAGFPMIWTQLLAARQVDALGYLGLLLVYMAVYQILPLAIFLAAVLTLKTVRVAEKEGRFLKLLAGGLMLALSAVMLVKPDLLNRLDMTALVFAGALALIGLIWLLDRLVRKPA